MRCKEHPAYEAKRHPARTTRHPDGCATCWGVWEAAKADPKNKASTVNVELTLDEARAVVLALNATLTVPAVPRTASAMLRPLMERMARDLKG